MIDPKTAYSDLPWEKEAYRMQDKLAQLVWDADILQKSVDRLLTISYISYVRYEREEIKWVQ